MAALTYQATPRTDGAHTVVRSTDDAIGSATAALVVDNTASKMAATAAIRALMRAWSRDTGKANAPADHSTSATTIE